MMKYLSNKSYEQQLLRIQLDNESKERKRRLKAEKNKYRRHIKLPSTSKLVMLGAILLCVHIVLFVEKVILMTGDTSAIYTLLGIPVSLIPIILGYYNKSKAENTAGGIVYDMAMRERFENQNCDNEAVG